MGPIVRRLPALLLPLVVGCLSPTLPMPPPGPQSVMISSDGMSAHIEGIGVPPKAEMHANNAELCRAAIRGVCGTTTTADVSGAYALDVPLDLPRYGYHFIDLSYVIDGDISGLTEFRIPKFGVWLRADADAGVADAGAD
jgi:hypothetical protein